MVEHGRRRSYIANRHVTTERWRDIALYALAGGLAFNVLLPIGFQFFRRVPPIDNYSPQFLRVSAFGLVFAVALVISEPIRVTRKHWGLLHLYPPLWISVALGVLFSLAADVLPQDLRPLRNLPPWRTWDVLVPLFLAFATAVALRQLPWRRQQRYRQVPPNLSGTLTWADIEKWISAEEPTTEHDFFNYGFVAERIAETLLTQKRLQSIALLAPFGGGKSSILRRVRWLLEESDHPRMIVAEVNAWAVPEPVAAPRIALERIVEAIREFVDAESLRGLPEAYKRLVAAEPSGVLAKLFGTESTGAPEAQLARLDLILAALRARLVVFVEDADRLAGRSGTRHLERFLDVLRNTERCSFVLAVNRFSGAKYDYTKLCEVIELVPSVEPLQVLRVLATSYEHWRSAPFIDPSNGAERVKRLHLDSGLSGLVDYLRRTRGSSPVHAIAELVNSPRLLKHLIRRVDRVWDQLAGEVDLDDLIALSVLRGVDNDAVFSFIATNIDAARNKAPDDRELGGRESIPRKWKAVIGRLAEREAIQELVDVLGITQLSSPRPYQQADEAVQGIRHAVPDYFRRILAERLLSSEPGDQRVLADQDRWAAHRAGPMLAELYETTDDRKAYAQTWLHYVHRVDYESIADAASRLLKWTLRDDGVNADVSSRAVWAFLVHSLISRRATEFGASWLTREIELALPRSLGLANDLFAMFGGGRDSILPEGTRPLVRQAMVGRARQTYTSGAALVAVLPSDPPAAKSRTDMTRRFALLHFMQPPDDPEDHGTKVRDLDWLVPVLLEAIPLRRVYVLRNIAHAFGRSTTEFVTNEGRRVAVTAYELNRPLFERYFGASTDDALQAFVSYQGDDEMVRAACEQATIWAHERSLPDNNSDA